MEARATLAVTLLLLVAMPVAGAVAGDDDLVNTTDTGTLADNTSVDGTLSDATPTGDGTIDGTTDQVEAETGTVGSTVDSTTDALGDADVTDLAGLEGTVEVGGEVDATADALGDAPPAVRSTLSSLDDGAPAGTDGGSTAPAMTTGGSGAGPSGAAALAPPGAQPGDGATGGDGVAAAVGAGAVLAGLAARGSALAGAGSVPTGANGGAAGTLRSRLGRLVRSLVPLRYSRRDGSDPLEHDDRARLMDVVESRPGTYLTGVAEAADLNLSTARHHLKVLEREGLVERATLRGRRRLFPANAESQALAAAMADDATAAVLDALARVEPCSTSELADELDRDPSTMSHHLQRLESDELVVRERDGRAQVARLAPEVAEVLAEEPPEAPASSPASAAD